jgi:cephalosporin-C deacetylase
MDTRGQGSGWSRGETSDIGPTGPQIPGVMTRGIRSPQDYYYRRLFTDAVRAVDAARSLDVVDPERIGVQGGSQGGGIALAVAGLRDDLAGVVAFVPFLCDFPRALTVTANPPYGEIEAYLRIHRDEVDQVIGTLRYFDGVNFARRATAPALFSTALADLTCPPSTVFGAYHEYAGPKSINIWPFNAHEGGAIEDELAAVAFLKSRLS